MLLNIKTFYIVLLNHFIQFIKKYFIWFLQTIVNQYVSQKTMCVMKVQF